MSLPPRIATLRSVGPYEGVLRDVVHAVKYEHRRSLLRHLAPMLRDAAADVLNGAHALVPVPLHVRRRWQRGFNQAELVADTLGGPVAHLLRRTRCTASQADLNAAARHTNVRGAFTLAGWTQAQRRRTQRDVEGQVLVLIDDVMTTGATLGACADVLWRAGAREVRAVTIARVSWDDG
jgi:ComF family protein